MIEKILICFIVPILYVVIMKTIIKIDADRQPHLLYISFIITLFIQMAVVYHLK